MKPSFKLLFSSLGAVMLGLAVALTPFLIQVQPAEYAAREKAEEAYIPPAAAPLPAATQPVAEGAPVQLAITSFVLVLVVSCVAAFVAFYLSRRYLTAKHRKLA